jgi:selenocysteine-specific elongation factor
VRVVATAGHVDHGKSTLVRALTGMEPDRWAEERRRGMTIDLGYAWTTLPSGEQLAFVDVPGHQRFIANMLAGIGPAPAVLFVVAADEGWSRQSDEHLAAVDALGLRHGVLAVTRSDLADPAATLADAAVRLSRSSLGRVPAVAVSAVTGAGLTSLVTELDRLVAELPPVDAAARMRLWVDRSFTVRGSGTVVTGTLGAGSIAVGDELELRGALVTVRSLQSMGAPRDRIGPVARVAVNLRGIPRNQVRRGDVLLSPGRWHWTSALDVRLHRLADLPAELTFHVGTAAVPVHVRPLDEGVARLALRSALPLQAGDRAVLRDPGRHAVAAGVLVVDADPPALRRRGAAAARAAELASAAGHPDPRTEVARRGAVRRDRLIALGIPDERIPDVQEVGEWLVTDRQWAEWREAVEPAVADWAASSPLDPGTPLAALRRAIGVPDAVLLPPLVAAAGLRIEDGRVRSGAQRSLGVAEAGVAEIERRLEKEPFAAPESSDLSRMGLGRRELAAAEKAGRLLRISSEIVLLPSAADVARERLRTLGPRFTTSEARQVLETTRRVAVPLLEFLDARGITERVDASTRRLR